MNNYTCFKCNKTFESELEPKFEFVNDYGRWSGIFCQCGGQAKFIGTKMGVYMPVEIFYNDGKSRKITKAHLKDIRSRAVTPDGTVLRGREGLKYNYAKGMKPTNLDTI